jgi:hypothetical protein
MAFRQAWRNATSFFATATERLRVPAQHPINPVYIEKFVRLIENGVSE